MFGRELRVTLADQRFERARRNTRLPLHIFSSLVVVVVAVSRRYALIEIALRLGVTARDQARTQLGPVAPNVLMTIDKSNQFPYYYCSDLHLAVEIVERIPRGFENLHGRLDVP